MTEKRLVERVALYLQYKHPSVIYRFDLAADLKLSIGQARRHKMIHPKRGYADLFIAEPRGGYAGLFIELKAAPIHKRDGSLRKNDHVAEQAKMLSDLAGRGYMAKFAVGFDEAVEIIDKYLVL